MLSLANLYPQLTGDLGYNASVLAMITFVKQTIISINYRDGLGDYEDWLTNREKNFRLKELPTFWDYCNYIFPLQSAVCGPSFEYKDWQDFLDRKGIYGKMKPFRNYPATFSRLLEGILCLVISIIIESYLPKDYILEKEFL